MFYNPAIGYPLTVAVVPRRLVGDEGWIAAEPMQQHVYTALARSVGDVLEPGNQSFAVWTWSDRDRAGRRVEISAGQWTTGYVATPKKLLAALRSLEVTAAALPGFGQRSLQVRYWTERGSGIARPGRLHVQIKVRVRDSARAQRARVVSVPAQVECLIRDFVEELA